MTLLSNNVQFSRGQGWALACFWTRTSQKCPCPKFEESCWLACCVVLDIFSVGVTWKTWKHNSCLQFHRINLMLSLCAFNLRVLFSQLDILQMSWQVVCFVESIKQRCFVVSIPFDTLLFPVHRSAIVMTEMVIWKDGWQMENFEDPSQFFLFQRATKAVCCCSCLGSLCVDEGHMVLLMPSENPDDIFWVESLIWENLFLWQLHIPANGDCTHQKNANATRQHAFNMPCSFQTHTRSKLCTGRKWKNKLEKDFYDCYVRIAHIFESTQYFIKSCPKQKHSLSSKRA